MLQNPSKTRLKSTRAEEIYFEHEELFFSITDLKGVILTGNKVFIRVSQYSKEELIGASHNIVRHGDMPRAAFKVLWTTIQSGEKIAAYVKNRARDGSYYWVVATLIPIKDGYLSIRFRPTSSLKGIVEKIYGEMLALEEKEGMERAIDYLLDQLQSLGFQDYQSFMVCKGRSKSAAVG
jgi:aerotaxis receptor